jgi:ferritin-like metal-binding protein YciE
MELNTLKDLYVHELQDLYSAEKQLIRALPKMAKAATNPKLKEGFTTHLEETKGHAERLEELLAKVGKSTKGKKCKGMEGLIAEAEELIKEKPDKEVLDAGLISAAQRVEHYEIAGYGCARTFAKVLKDKESMSILQTTLDEEGKTDKLLTKLAESSINVQAATAGNGQ